MHLLETFVDPWPSVPARSYHLAAGGERVGEREPEPGRGRQERPSGKHAGACRLPEDPSDSHIHATYAAGVLDLRVRERKSADSAALVPIN